MVVIDFNKNSSNERKKAGVQGVWSFHHLASLREAGAPVLQNGTSHTAMSKAAPVKATKAVSFRLLVPAGKAAPQPPVGPALGQRGIKSIDFCKQFNDRTKHLVPGTPTPCVITVNPDRTFTFVTKTPPASWLLLRAAGVEKGAGKTGEEVAGTVSVKHIYEIAKIKQADMLGGRLPLESVAKTIVGQTRSMGLKVVL